jgi:hypothetical protein
MWRNGMELRYSQINGVYYVESQNSGFNPIAIRVHFVSGYAAWEDTAHGRSIRYKKVHLDGKELPSDGNVASSKIPEVVEIVAERDGKEEKFRLVKLTKNVFNEKVVKLVAAGEKLKSLSDEELQQHYLQTNFDAY